MNIISVLLSHLNYGTIFILMLLESTVVPVPSEFVVTPAAYHAAAGHLNVVLVVAISTMGVGSGASINYVISYWLGRPAIYKFAKSKLGRLCLLTQERIERSEQFFLRHGAIATFLGRFVVGIRHLISIPAGLARMSYIKFLLYTLLGGLGWNSLLAIIGWWLHSFVPEEELNDTINEYSGYIKFLIIIIVTALIAILIVKNYKRKERA